MAAQLAPVEQVTKTEEMALAILVAAAAAVVARQHSPMTAQLSLPLAAVELGTISVMEQQDHLVEPEQTETELAGFNLLVAAVQPQPRVPMHRATQVAREALARPLKQVQTEVAIAAAARQQAHQAMATIAGPVVPATAE